MRQIINISLPQEVAKQVKKEVKAGGFASTSEFFRHLLRLWNTAKLARELKKAQKDFVKGKNWKVLNSLEDLE